MASELRKKLEKEIPISQGMLTRLMTGEIGSSPLLEPIFEILGLEIPWVELDEKAGRLHALGQIARKHLSDERYAAWIRSVEFSLSAVDPSAQRAVEAWRRSQTDL